MPSYPELPTSHTNQLTFHCWVRFPCFVASLLLTSIQLSCLAIKMYDNDNQVAFVNTIIILIEAPSLLKRNLGLQLFFRL